MKNTFLIASCLIYFGCVGISGSLDKPPGGEPAMPPVSHKIWDGLLKKHVRPDGMVDYGGMIHDSSELNLYLRLLESSHPNHSWSREEQKAYWINAYNAFTIKLIVDHYPINSIKDIKNGIPFVNTVWDIPFIRIQAKQYDLNDIEHGILRKQFPDGRVHAAVNCASVSCPPLRPEAYVGEQLEAQLNDAMRRFVNDPLRNRISAEKAELSAIFNWFRKDFRKDAGSLRAFVNRFTDNPLNKKTSISFLTYDWSLNDDQ